MTNPHEKLAMEFFSPPGPSAREWRCRHRDRERPFEEWICGASKSWPKWLPEVEYQIRLKPQTITLPERTIPKPLDVGELVSGRVYWKADPTEYGWAVPFGYSGDCALHPELAKRGFVYPYTNQGKADAIAAAKGMIGRDEG